MAAVVAQSSKASEQPDPAGPRPELRPNIPSAGPARNCRRHPPLHRDCAPERQQGVPLPPRSDCCGSKSRAKPDGMTQPWLPAPRLLAMV